MIKKIFLCVFFSSSLFCMHQDLLDLNFWLNLLDGLSKSKINTRESLIADNKKLLENFISPGLESIRAGAEIKKYKLEDKIAHKSKIRTIAISNDAKFAITSSIDQAIIWDLKKLNQPSILSKLKSSFETIAMSSDNKFALSAALSDSKINVFDIHNLINPKLLYSISEKSKNILDLKINHDNSFAISISQSVISPDGGDNFIKVWDLSSILKKMQLLSELTVNDGIRDLKSVVISNNNDFILVGNALYEGKIRRKKVNAKDLFPLASVYNLQDKKEIKLISMLERSLPLAYGFNSISMSDNNKIALVNNGLWDIKDLDKPKIVSKLEQFAEELKNKELDEFSQGTFEDITYEICKISLNGQFSITYASFVPGNHVDYLLSIWDTTSKTDPKRIIIYNLIGIDRISTLVISPLNNFFITNSEGNWATIWDIANTWIVEELNKEQVELLIKIANLKSYNNELQIKENLKVFETLNPKLQEYIVQYLKKALIKEKLPSVIENIVSEYADL